MVVRDEEDASPKMQHQIRAAPRLGTKRSPARKMGSALPRGCFWPLNSQILLFQGEHLWPGKKEERHSRGGTRET